MPYKIVLNVLTPSKLTNRAEGRDVLEFLCNSYPDLVPQKYSYFEPIRLNFDKNDIESAVSGWGRSFLWKRKKPEVDGSVWSAWGKVPVHGWFTSEFLQNEVSEARLIEFLLDTSTLLESNFSLFHVLNAKEASITRRNGTIGQPNPAAGDFSLNVTSHQLKKYVPNLYWGTVFGKPYVDLVGRETMLSAPAHKIVELPYGGIYVQLSSSIYDLVTNYDQVDQVRQTVKDHLGHNIFYEPDAFEDQTYDVPDFHLSER